ncbi:putative nucleotidyltransferase substrate binding domain-containing protein [Thermocrinis sp.]
MKEPDNYINSEKLSKQERGLLKDAFRVVENFQEFLRHSFGGVLLE